jgi:bifunctional ADP-heptose synthase (sugar kinase/adenylyltransferase)
VINLATTHTGGKVVYKDGLNIRLDPGQEAVAEVTDVTGAGDTARVILYLEPVWERPANIAAMVATT